MNTPHPELMEHYGTDAYFLEKSGAIPMGALRAVAGLGFMGVAHYDAKHRANLLAEADLMNQRFRVVENKRMAPVLAGLMGKSASASPELLKVAASIGRQMAKKESFEKLGAEAMDKLASGTDYDDLTEMEKEAIGFLGGIAKALGGVASKAGASIGSKLLGAGGRAAEFGGKSGAGLLRQQVGKVGLKLEGAGSKLIKSTAPVTGRAQTATQTISSAGPWASKSSVSEAVPTKGRLPPPPAPPAAAASAAAPAASAAAPAAASAAAPAAAAAAPDVAKETAKKSLLGWKGKAALGLGATGVAYGGYKGLQTARDYMMTPAHSSRWGGYGPQPQSAASSFGGGYVGSY